MPRSRARSFLPGSACSSACPREIKWQLIVQKAVELGASEIVPVSSRRCVVRLDRKKAEHKVSRWNGVAASAAKQSKRMMRARGP